jgi:hypothetical protein
VTGIAVPLDEAKFVGMVDAAVRLTPAFCLGTENLDVASYRDAVIPGGRTHLLEPVRHVLDECMRRYNQVDAAASDAWLGPRLHATLRLSRREAGSRGVWRFLGLWAADYVRWRFGPPPGEDDLAKAAQPERFVGPNTKQAMARLWWMAELFRNGKDYGPAALALTNQDIVNNLFRMRLSHHRPTALAALRVLPRSEDGTSLPHGRQANALAKATNAAASTLVLDVVATDPHFDLEGRGRWELDRDYDPRTCFDTLPEGPDDGDVPDEVLTDMEHLLTELFAEAPVRGKPDASG